MFKKFLIFLPCLFLGLVASAATTNRFTSDTGCVVLSTTPASPTQILSTDSTVKRTVVVNPTAELVFVSYNNTTISTSTASGNFYIPANSSWSPDGPLDPYIGSMWAVQTGTGTAQGICRQRSK